MIEAFSLGETLIFFRPRTFSFFFPRLTCAECPSPADDKADEDVDTEDRREDPILRTDLVALERTEGTLRPVRVELTLLRFVVWSSRRLTTLPATLRAIESLELLRAPMKKFLVKNLF